MSSIVTKMLWDQKHNLHRIGSLNPINLLLCIHSQSYTLMGFSITHCEKRWVVKLLCVLSMFLQNEVFPHIIMGKKELTIYYTRFNHFCHRNLTRYEEDIKTCVRKWPYKPVTPSGFGERTACNSCCYTAKPQQIPVFCRACVTFCLSHICLCHLMTVLVCVHTVLVFTCQQHNKWLTQHIRL